MISRRLLYAVLLSLSFVFTTDAATTSVTPMSTSSNVMTTATSNVQTTSSSPVLLTGSSVQITGSSPVNLTGSSVQTSTSSQQITTDSSVQATDSSPVSMTVSTGSSGVTVTDTSLQTASSSPVTTTNTIVQTADSSPVTTTNTSVQITASSPVAITDSSSLQGLSSVPFTNTTTTFSMSESTTTSNQGLESSATVSTIQTTTFTEASISLASTTTNMSLSTTETPISLASTSTNNVSLSTTETTTNQSISIQTSTNSTSIIMSSEITVNMTSGMTSSTTSATMTTTTPMYPTMTPKSDGFYILRLNISSNGVVQCTGCNYSSVKDLIRDAFMNITGFLYVMPDDTSSTSSVPSSMVNFTVLIYFVRSQLQTVDNVTLRNAFEKLNSSATIFVKMDEPQFSQFISSTVENFKDRCLIQDACESGYYCKNDECVHMCDGFSCGDHGMCLLAVKDNNTLEISCSCESNYDLVYSGEKCENSEMNKDKAARIVGGVLGAVVGILIIVIIVLCIRQRNSSNKQYNIHGGGYTNNGYSDISMKNL